MGTGRIAPNILIVLDRSLSMKPDDGSVNRWDPSVAAIKTITSNLQARVAFGLMTFSGDGGGGGRGGGGNLSCGAGRVNVDIEENTAGAIAQALDRIQPAGATPTAVTMQAADDYLRNYQGGPDDRPAPTYVLLVTDGAPNCTNGIPPMGNASAVGSQEPAQVDTTVAVIEQMAGRGFKTYVLGYDTQTDAALKAALDQMAQAGGTGASAHSAIEDEAGLVEEFRSIIGMAAVGCTFSLKTPPSDPNFVRVELDGEKLELDYPEGFVLDADRTAITQTFTPGFDWGTNQWHQLRVTRSETGEMAVSADGAAAPLLTASDTRLGSGYVGFGSFDDKGRVRNVKLWAPSADATPAAFFDGK